MSDHKDAPNISQLGGRVVDLARYVDNNVNWGATNPSIGYYPNKGLVTTIRSSNYIIDPQGNYVVQEGHHFVSRIFFSELTKDLKLRKLRQIDLNGLESDYPRGLEDAKLFFRDGHWHFTCVVPGVPEPGKRASRMAIAKLDHKCTKIIDFKKYPGPDPGTPEKNWMVPYQPSPHFDWIYGPNAIVKNHQLRTYMTDHPTTTALRGSSNLHLLGDGTYLAVLHKKYLNRTQQVNAATFGFTTQSSMNYTHMFARYDVKGNLLQISDPFIFYKPGVEFAAGLTMRDKDFLISFGRQDVSSHIAILPVRTVIESLKSIDY